MLLFDWRGMPCVTPIPILIQNILVAHYLYQVVVNYLVAESVRMSGNDWEGIVNYGARCSSLPLLQVLVRHY